MIAATRGFRGGRIAGVDVRVDWSLLIVFWLIVVNLGGGLFPARHPDWTPMLNWGVAAIAAVLFFLSILAHELSHALVGRANGVPVAGITLFIFGGVADRLVPSHQVRALWKHWGEPRIEWHGGSHTSFGIESKVGMLVSEALQRTRLSAA